MYQNGTEATSGFNSTGSKHVFYCPETPDFTWDLDDTTLIWVLAVVILIVSPIAVLLDALVIIAVKQKRELQKRSNILLSSMAVSDLLLRAISMPICAIVDLLIVHQVWLENVCTLDTNNIDLMFIFLASSIPSLYHLPMIAWERYVAIRKWMDYKVIVTGRRIKTLAVIAWLVALSTAGPVPILKAVGVDFEFIYMWMNLPFVCGTIAFILIVYFYVTVYLGVRKQGVRQTKRYKSLLLSKRNWRPKLPKRLRC